MPGVVFYVELENPGDAGVARRTIEPQEHPAGSNWPRFDGPALPSPNVAGPQKCRRILVGLQRDHGVSGRSSPPSTEPHVSRSYPSPSQSLHPPSSKSASFRLLKSTTAVDAARAQT